MDDDDIPKLIIVGAMVFMPFVPAVPQSVEPAPVCQEIATSMLLHREPTPTPSPTPTPTPTVAPRPTTRVVSNTWIGKGSIYSRAGCLGCSATLTMANGETLDDDAHTVAFNWAPLNSFVRITNLDNGMEVVARVTDTGGFNALGRVIDITPGTNHALGGIKTDVTTLKIELLDN